MLVCFRLILVQLLQEMWDSSALTVLQHALFSSAQVVELQCRFLCENVQKLYLHVRYYFSVLPMPDSECICLWTEAEAYFRCGRHMALLQLNCHMLHVLAVRIKSLRTGLPGELRLAPHAPSPLAGTRVYNTSIIVSFS